MDLLYSLASRGFNTVFFVVVNISKNGPKLEDLVFKANAICHCKQCHTALFIDDSFNNKTFYTQRIDPQLESSAVEHVVLNRTKLLFPLFICTT